MSIYNLEFHKSSNKKIINASNMGEKIIKKQKNEKQTDVKHFLCNREYYMTVDNGVFNAVWDNKYLCKVVCTAKLSVR